MTRQAKAADGRRMPPASWAGRTLVVLVDGPLGRRWYFQDWWDRYRTSEENAGRPPAYRLTKQTAQNPEYAATGAVWRWTGSKETA